MNILFRNVLIVMVSVLFIPVSHSQNLIDSVSLGAGYSLDDDVLGRIGLQHNLDYRWLESDTGRLTVYWDLSYNRWFLRQDDDFSIVALSPVFSYQFEQALLGAKPVIEVGIGVSYISDRYVNDRDMGGHFQFEDRIAAGLKYDSLYLALMYVHYSNGGLYDENAGYNTVLVNAQYYW